MRFASCAHKNHSCTIATIGNGLIGLLLLVFACAAHAQKCPLPDNGQYPMPPFAASPLTYPLTSDQYAVEYRLDNGPWMAAHVYISIYGGTNASPYEPFTNYLPFSNYPDGPTTSMSFVSIPARANALVQLRVTKKRNGPFSLHDHVSIRPAVKGIRAELINGKAQISAFTFGDFAGEQFILWWDRGDNMNGGAMQGLAFFLDPPYDPPTGRVATITAQTDLNSLNLHAYDSLDFEGTVELPGAQGDVGPEGAGAQELVLPVNINTVYLAPGSWVQGKIRFDGGDTNFPGGQVKKIYGPGVLDSSRFAYVFRQCRNADGTVTSGTLTGNQLDGLATLSWIGNPKIPDTVIMDGIVITDSDYTSTGSIVNGTVNNVKVIGWNGNNDGLQFGDGTRASHVFIRTGDDSLELWGSPITVTNATIWQNFSGGVVNLGWNNQYSGENNLVDGLFVVRTDWDLPSAPSWTTDLKDPLAHQNNGIIVSLQTPGTTFGKNQPSMFRNIFVDDTPQVIFNLKILPPDCNLSGLKGGQAGCPHIDMTQSSLINIKIENVVTQQSTVENFIGFQTLPVNFSYLDPSDTAITLSQPLTLAGSMNIDLTNVFIKPLGDNWAFLTSANAVDVGKLCTNGNDSAPVDQVCMNASNVNISYSFDPFALLRAFLAVR